MKKLFLVPIAAMMLFACKKADSVRELPGDAGIKNQVSLIDESEVLKPKGGYSSSKRSDDFIASQQRGKPVKNNVENITSLTTTVRSAYQIDLNWYGVRNAVSYNIYRNDVLVSNTKQPYFFNYGLSPSTKYKYQVAAVASNGAVGNLSNIAYGTTHSTDIGSKILIFLQFDKDTVTGPWTSYNDLQPIITEASGFTEEEKQIITDGIAADYAQFPNIRVTRNRSEYDATDKAKRTKTIFTISHEWYSGGPTPTAGGVSFLNTLGLDIPNWVFTSALYYNTYYNTVAGTHEDGHAIGGLRHAIDVCGQTYGGDGNHMGAAYHQAYRFWKDGQMIAGCGYQDQIILLNSRTQ